ncbi:MAG: hypothetical protein ACI4AM_08280 [Muribaculaceae bacterium]
MKHFILLAAMGIAAISASAQSQCQQQCQAQCQQQCCDSTACHQQRPARQLRQAAVDPFAGIDLTADQRAAVDSLQAGQRQSQRQLRQQARREYLDQLKQILTPEQYVQYLENLAINGYDRPVGQNRRLRQPAQFNDSVPSQPNRRAPRHHRGQRQQTPQQ